MRHAKPPILVKSAVRLLFNVLKGFAFQTCSASPDFCLSAADLRPETVYISPSLYGTVLRQLNTIVCAGVLAMSLGACGGSADETELHPVLGKRPPRDVLGRDIMALPELERTAWVHGAIAGAATALSVQGSDATPCMMALYEQSDGYEVLMISMERNPNMPASAAVLAVANQACPTIRAQN